MQVFFSDIDSFMEQLEGKRVLLVCGRSFDSLPVCEKINGAVKARFGGFSPNPVYEDICRGVDLFRSEECDAVLAVGGGSAMDTAKCIKLFSGLSEGTDYLAQDHSENGVPLYAVPTTAGTGSESTAVAVIYRDGRKISVRHPSLIPSKVCLVPELLKRLPEYQKKCTMLDALCQAVESFWSVSSTPESIEYAKRAAETISSCSMEYVFECTDRSCGMMMEAANLAGRAICITGTTAPHAMSYMLTTGFGLPHGHAVALSMAEIWRFISENMDRCSDPRGEEHLKKVLESLPLSLDGFLSMLEVLEIGRPKSGSRESDAARLAGAVDISRLKNSPVIPTRYELEQMYLAILS